MALYESGQFREPVRMLRNSGLCVRPANFLGIGWSISHSFGQVVATPEPEGAYRTGYAGAPGRGEFSPCPGAPCKSRLRGPCEARAEDQTHSDSVR